MSINCVSQSSEAKMEPESMNEPCLRNWLDLPRDLTASILLRLGTTEIIESAQKVCTQWHNICKDPSMWRSIDVRVPSDRYPIDVEKMKKICMNAIDRSNGGLVDLNIEYIGTDELLSCVTQRTSHLRRLRLVFRWGISDDALSEAGSKLPLLEELEIHCRPICYSAIEVFGRRCPLLKTFKFSRWGFGYSSDDEAQAIAQHMHGLRHLHLVGSNLTNHGLKAILDGCPYLESLDLRRCLFVDLQGDMGKRCAQQMKNLRRPNDSIDDYEFAAELNRPDDDDYDYDGYYDYYSSDFSFDDDDDGYMLDYGYDRLIYDFEDYIIYD